MLLNSRILASIWMLDMWKERLILFWTQYIVKIRKNNTCTVISYLKYHQKGNSFVWMRSRFWAMIVMVMQYQNVSSWIIFFWYLFSHHHFATMMFQYFSRSKLWWNDRLSNGTYRANNVHLFVIVLVPTEAREAMTLMSEIFARVALHCSSRRWSQRKKPLTILLMRIMMIIAWY